LYRSYAKATAATVAWNSTHFLYTDATRVVGTPYKLNPADPSRLKPPGVKTLAPIK
jgi:hypothetical protein